jgi:phosphate transport system substrate-binding protein
LIKNSIAIVLLALFMSTAAAQKLNGAGSTFSAPIYMKWFTEYGAAHPGVHISYQAIGSSRGIREVTTGLVDFGATDGPMTDYQLASARIKVLHIPTVLGAVVPIFNIPGISGIKLSPGVLAGIFLGQIQNWSDPRIAQDNPGLSLPSRKILVVHRSDGSGTTYIFTDYLSKVSKEWAGGPGTGTAPEWPIGVGGKGNEGVARLVRESPGAIGYVELTYALRDHISYGEVKNAAGQWVSATIEGVTEAAASMTSIPADYRVSIVNAPGERAYPISSFTWLLVPLKSSDPVRSRLLKDLLQWIVTSGQKDVSALSYAPLPEPVAQKVLATVAALQ